MRDGRKGGRVIRGRGFDKKNRNYTMIKAAGNILEKKKKWIDKGDNPFSKTEVHG